MSGPGHVRMPPFPEEGPAAQLDREKGTALVPHESFADENSSSTGSFATQAGVKRVEAVTSSWTKLSLAIAYISLFLMACSTSLEVLTTSNLTAFATSAFSAHSLISTVAVVQGVVNSVIKPPMSKVADVFGRLEAFSFTVLLYVIGYIQMAGANNVKTYASAQIFYSAGSQGLQILQQIFVADTTDLLNRALFSTIFDIPFLVTVWVGSPIAQRILAHSTWRWGYGIWAIILPAVFLPLALSLFMNQRKASKMGILPPSPLKGMSAGSTIKSLWYDLDLFGLLLFSAAVSLILIPLTLAARAKGGWSNGSIIAMIVIGGVCLVIFPFWERSKKLAPQAFFPRELFRERTVLAGIAIGFFYFMAFYLSVFPYFYSYLLVVQGKSVTAAGHITQTFSFTSTVASIIISFVIKYTGHYKYFVTLGSCIYLLGIGLMIRYRHEGVSTSALVGCQVAIGIGGGMLNVPAQLGVQASASHQQVAAATAVFLTILEVGGAVGSAISGAVWSNNIPKKLTQYLPPESKNQALLIYGNITLATTGWAAGTPERIAINRAYQETMQIMLIIAVCVCVPLIPLSLLMKNYKLAQMDQKVRGKVIGGDRGERDPVQPVPENYGSGDNSATTSRKGSLLDRFRVR